ncbi:MAG: ABC transporter ATP-binding protein [Proteobacteria bacterium]|nr:ABC transporter ATP-binding protein [Pseudomonadota bacterium]
MILQTNGVSVRYGAAWAVRDVTLTARACEVLAVVGANGSGKSSLVRALAGVQRHEGTVLWDGAPTPAGRIGYMPQDTATRAALTVFEVVLLGRLRGLAMRVNPRDLAAAEAALTEVGIADLADRRIDELSGGQRQMVLLAQVLAGDPLVLLLDEPTSALDIAHQLHVLATLRAATRQRRLITVAVLHDLNAAARFADQVALLHGGRLLAHGAPMEVLRPPMLELAFDVHVAVDPGSDGHPVVLPLRARWS